MQHEAPAARDASFDVLKGIGILGVIVLHVSNWSGTRLTMSGSNTWAALVLTNRLMNIAVPLFLMVSALLLSRSRGRSKEGWGAFYIRRVQGLLWPFLVWTVIFWIGRFLGQEGIDPEFWTNYPDRLRDLLLGKASYHLYFMSVLLQFVVAFPLLYAILRKVKTGFFGILIASAGCQALVMILQKQIRFPAPGSIFLWYLMPLLIGVWLGQNWSMWPDIWRRIRWGVLLLFALTLVWFMDVNVRQIAGDPFTSNEHKWSHTTFTLLGSLTLLGLSLRWYRAASPAAWLMQHLGENSLQLYLIHPLLLSLLARPEALTVLKRLPYSPVWVVMILVVGSYLAGAMIGLAGLDPMFFGRGGRNKRQPA